jgi:hypothetical protein
VFNRQSMTIPSWNKTEVKRAFVMNQPTQMCIDTRGNEGSLTLLGTLRAVYTELQNLSVVCWEHGQCGDPHWHKEVHHGEWNSANHLVFLLPIRLDDKRELTLLAIERSFKNFKRIYK